MRKLIVHENFTASMNDIALLQLGKKGLSGDPLIIGNLQTKEWISQSSALPVFLALVKALLTRMGTSMVSSISPREQFTLFLAALAALYLPL